MSWSALLERDGNNLETRERATEEPEGLKLSISVTVSQEAEWAKHEVKKPYKWWIHQILSNMTFF